MPTRRNKKSNDAKNGETHQETDREEDELMPDAKLAPEASDVSMASLQASLDAINSQLSALRKDVKRDLRTFKDEITTQMEEKLAEFNRDITQKFTNVNTEMKEQSAKVDDALLRTEEVEEWSAEVNQTLQDLLEEREMMMDKLDSIESQSRRCNLRLYNFPEDAEPENESMVKFIGDWLRKEIIDTDLSIQRAHRALAPKRNPDQPPRSIVINFQRFDVKELVLSKAWEKKIVKFGDTRIYFDHDYTERVLKLRKSYAEVKKVLNTETPKIKFNTPYTKIRIHWASGKVMYHSAEEATEDMRKRGLRIDGAERNSSGSGGDNNTGNGEREPTLIENLRRTRLAGWTRIGGNSSRDVMRRRVRGRLQVYKR